MAKTPANAEQLLTRPRPAGDREGARRGGRDPEADRRREGRLPGHRGGLGPLLGEGAQGRVRPRRVGDPALLRSRARPAGRRLLRRQQDVRHHLQGAQGHPGLPSGRPRLGGLRRRRHARSPSTTATSSCGRRRAAARGATASSTRAGSSAGSRPSRTTPTSPSPPRASPRSSPSTNVDTLFHEFGHALHGIFQNVEYPTLGSTPRDFVEFPSSFNEHWAYEPTVFANYAKHYKTGEPMPAALVEKIKKTKTFNQGYITTEYLASALLDMAWHSLPAGATPQDVDAFEKSTLERRKVEPARGAAPISHDLLLAHLGRGLRRRLLRLLLVGGPQQRRLLLVHGERRHDAEERRPLPRHDPLARRERGRRGDVPGIPRPRSRDRAASSRSAGSREARAFRPASRRSHECETPDGSPRALHARSR